ncbi:AAA family ATPase [Desulfosporosinus shakirovi]|uniref:AAA family ATPase n=1 Tax=Desulfosporosinus shakirovi TaxID=2885154 RepID=UPI001E5A4A98|nr:hypothetical protein [Desulfosporosinus sp. SRJS8]MCB8818332.1 hypothetical protein [Desulfosporosinus sp. SRJS8]
MLKENTVRQTDEPVLINVHGMGANDWESWLAQIGFQVVVREEANVLLWVDPEEKDWSLIASDSRSIVVGKPEVMEECQKKSIAYIKDVNNGEAIQRQFVFHAQAQIQNPILTKGSSFTVPPALSPGFPEKKRGLGLQRKLGIRKAVPEQPDKQISVEDEVVTEEYPDHTRKELIIALPLVSNEVKKLQPYLQEKSGGELRVLEIVHSFSNLMRNLDLGIFSIIVVHRDLPGLEGNLVESMRELRSHAFESRIIVIERESDDYSATYKSHLKNANIEWQVIPQLPGNLLSVLQGAIVSSPTIEFKWDEEPVSSPYAPKAITTVMSPVLFATHSTGGGIGKSTIAQQTGFVFAKMGYKTIIIELDSEKPSLLRGTGASEDCPGLDAWVPDDFSNEGAAMTAIKRTSRQVRGLYVLPAGPISSKKAILPFHMESSNDACQQAETLFKAALKEFQIVIVDTNPNLIDPPVFKALEMAKRIFYIMEATKVYLDSAATHLSEAYKLGVESSKYQLIINKRTDDDPVKLRAISQAMDMPIILEVPLDVQGYRNAADKGRPYKPKKGPSPWEKFCETVLQDIGVSIVLASETKSPFAKFFTRWRKK